MIYLWIALGVLVFAGWMMAMVRLIDTNHGWWGAIVATAGIIVVLWLIAWKTANEDLACEQKGGEMVAVGSHWVSTGKAMYEVTDYECGIPVEKEGEG